jgi:tetratricopeptide (TPR) repeat protein
MRHMFAALFLSLVFPVVLVAPAALAQSADEPVTCSPDSKRSPEEIIGICGMSIESNATYSVRVHALVTRAEAYRRMEQYDLAIKDCDEAIRLDPASAEAFDCRGNVFVSDRKFERALDDFDRSIKLAPKFARAMLHRAATFAVMREIRLAVRDYTEAIRLDLDNVQAITDRAEAYIKVKRADLAIDDYSQAIRLEPASRSITTVADHCTHATTLMTAPLPISTRRSVCSRSRVIS